MGLGCVSLEIPIPIRRALLIPLITTTVYVYVYVMILQRFCLSLSFFVIEAVNPKKKNLCERTVKTNKRRRTRKKETQEEKLTNSLM